MSLYTRIHVVVLDAMRSSGPGEVPLTTVAGRGVQVEDVRVAVVTRRMKSGVKLAPWS